MMTEVRAPFTKFLPEGINVWTQLILGIIAVGGMIWAAIAFFDPIGDLDLTVQILEEVPVSLPQEAGSLPIELTYQGSRITRALFLGLEISNTGNRPLGSNNEKWRLTLRTVGRSELSLLGGLRRKPENLDVKIVGDEIAGPDRIVLEIGLLNAADTIGLQAIIINPSPDADAEAQIVAEARIPDLAEPVVTRLNVRDRLQKAFMPPLWIFLWILFFVAQLVESIWKRNLNIPGAVLGLFVSAFASIFVAEGIAWILGTLAAAAIH
jgi:hypothetical protein